MIDGDSIVVLISGRGSNLLAILDSSVGRLVAGVVSDNPDAAGLEFAVQYGVPTEIVPFADDKKKFESALADAIEIFSPTIIALAGFMRILSGEFIARFGGRIVNIHPSLLPNFPGLETHRRVLEAGEKTHGCTVHWVTKKIDGGKKIRRAKVKVLPDDDADSLAARVLDAEHKLYPEVLGEILARKMSPPMQ